MPWYPAYILGSGYGMVLVAGSKLGILGVLTLWWWGERPDDVLEHIL